MQHEERYDYKARIANLRHRVCNPCLTLHIKEIYNFNVFAIYENNRLCECDGLTQIANQRHHVKHIIYWYFFPFLCNQNNLCIYKAGN